MRKGPLFAKFTQITIRGDWLYGLDEDGSIWQAFVLPDGVTALEFEKVWPPKEDL